MLNAGAPLRVLEIGCFDGSLLDHLRRCGHDVVGCDPSQGARIAAERFGIRVERAFFSGALFVRERFDRVIARNIIEHLEDPVGFLKEIRDILAETGEVIIETTDYTLALEHGYFTEFVIEHLCAFVPETLRRAVIRAGFVPLRFLSGHHMILTARRAASSSLPASRPDLRHADVFQKRFEEVRGRFTALVQADVADGRVPVLYGGGRYSSMLLDAVGEVTARRCRVVDDDPGKRSLVLSGYGLPIEDPATLLRDPNTAVYPGSCYAGFRDAILSSARRHGVGPSRFRNIYAEK
jgi:SAM-dependent methyltransferase